MASNLASFAYKRRSTLLFFDSPQDQERNEGENHFVGDDSPVGKRVRRKLKAACSSDEEGEDDEGKRATPGTALSSSNGSSTAAASAANDSAMYITPTEKTVNKSRQPIPIANTTATTTATAKSSFHGNGRGRGAGVEGEVSRDSSSFGAEDKIALLHEMFPNFEVDVIRSVFEASGDTSIACSSLFDMASTTPATTPAKTPRSSDRASPPEPSPELFVVNKKQRRVSPMRFEETDKKSENGEADMVEAAEVIEEGGEEGEANEEETKGSEPDIIVLDDEGSAGESRHQRHTSKYFQRGERGIDKQERGEEDVQEVMDEEEQEESDGSQEDASGHSADLLAKVVDFFNSATRAELERCPRSSAIRAGLVIKARPFDDYDQLWESFDTTRGLSTAMVESLAEQLQAIQAVDKLMSDCEEIAQTIRSVTEPLEKGDEVNSGHVGRPSTIPESMKLQDYQLAGLNWLVLLHRNDINAVLADEMGLGKTVQSIAFLAHLLAEGDKGPHLIVVPASTLDNWSRELQRWCPDLEILHYQGSQGERYCMQDDLFSGRLSMNVILTTYNTAVSSAADRQFLRKYNFSSIIFDEGHMLKDMKTQRYTHLMRLRGRRRILLTGTPVQNNLVELMSLLTFVMPRVFRANADQLKAVFSRGSESKEHAALVAAATRIMAPFVLRRTKDLVCLHLPEKRQVVRNCPMTEFQNYNYNQLIHDFRQQKSNASATRPQDRLANLFMHLRKMALHPLLHRCRYTDDQLPAIARGLLQTDEYCDCSFSIVLEDLSCLSDFQIHQYCMRFDNLAKYRLDPSCFEDAAKCLALREILKEKKQKGDRVLVFSQFTTMLDVLEVFLDFEQHTYLRLDGQTPVEERQSMIDEFSENSGIFVFLLSTKAGGLGINLTAANVVVLHDMDFNPHNDKQAEDRCHRLGQTRTVEVIRLVAPDTVEAVMWKMAADKLRLDANLSSGKSDMVDASLLDSLRKQYGL